MSVYMIIYVKEGIGLGIGLRYVGPNIRIGLIYLVSRMQIKERLNSIQMNEQAVKYPMTDYFKNIMQLIGLQYNGLSRKQGSEVHTQAFHKLLGFVWPV